MEFCGIFLNLFGNEVTQSKELPENVLKEIHKMHVLIAKKPGS